MKIRFLAAATIALLLSACGQNETARRADDDAMSTAGTLSRSASPDGARVFFITPASTDTLSNPISIEFGIAGMDIVKAGDQQPHSGHHHLLVDTGLPELAMPIPADSNHIHFGDASTSTELSLEPGEYTLQLLLGDYLHIPHDPPLVSQRIAITGE